MSLLIKDICRLGEFLKTIRIIRRVLCFFGKSVHSSALLEERRKLLKIRRGLEAIVETWFGTVVIAAKSLLRCMPAIRALVVEEAIVIPEHNNLFLGSSPASIMFEMQLTVLISVLDPILRGLTCLESSFSTPADSARLDKHLRSGSHGITNPQTIDEVRRLSSKRISELINESPDDLYVTSFHLDPLYRDSRLLRDIDPFTIKITLKVSDEFSLHAPTLGMMRRIGRFLFDMLQKEWDNYPNGVVRGMCSNAMEAKETLRQQLLLYTSSTYPFSAKVKANAPALDWWKPLQHNPASQLLAHFAIKLFSITANSMADERTVSTFGWLNSALRSRQDVATIVRQTQIRQFYAWDEDKHQVKRSQIRYRDFKNTRSSEVPESTPSVADNAMSDVSLSDRHFSTDYAKNVDEWLDEHESNAPEANPRLIELGCLVDLNAPEIDDCLADEAPASLKDKRRALDEPKDTVGQSQDKELGEDNWDFL
ncbi:hypothetical protein RhiJN_00104 [Ceratobasidium sp. AG-Ba]|nr:hypothetical protein RhiJN_00104 [Ceratobasidium sp. AG-Ba]QRW01144.1 hypothetical protein RhiLY_00141 [Ceratobasidium sp. AG-Ba]